MDDETKADDVLEQKDTESIEEIEGTPEEPSA